MNATARRAHYVFPTKLPYERHDATTLVDSFFAKPFAQMATPLIEAPEGVLDDWELFWGLSRRAGRVQTLMEYKWGGGVGREYVMDMQVKPRSEELMRWLCESGSLSFDELRAHPEGVVFDLEPLVIAPAGEDDGARLDVCPPDVAEELASVADASDSRRYRLAVRRMLETMNSAFRDASVTRRRYPINHAFMNPADMAREGLKTGDPIEIVSDAGKIVGHARADDTVREGVISMSHQWGQPDPADDPRGETGAFTGRLVSLERDLETINYMPRQSGVPVDIRILAAAKADA